MSDEHLHDLFPGLLGFAAHALPAADEPRLRDALERAGFAVQALEGREVRDQTTFFAELRRALRLPDEFGANWDAFTDLLGELHDGCARRVAFLWRDAQVCLQHDAATVLAVALACDRAADSLDDDADLEPLQLELFLLGSGPAFGG